MELVGTLEEVNTRFNDFHNKSTFLGFYRKHILMSHFYFFSNSFFSQEKTIFLQIRSRSMKIVLFLTKEKIICVKHDTVM